MTRDYATPVETSRIMKRALRKRFPAIKFSVRLSRGTGWGNCSVRWTDGPSTKLVQEITKRFEGSGFDGMTDSSYHVDNPLPDGRQTGISLLSEHRSISATFAQRLANAVANFYGVDSPQVKENGSEYWEIADLANVARTGESWYTLIHRASQDRESVQRQPLRVI